LRKKFFFYLNTINYLVNDGIQHLESIKTKLQNDSFITGDKSRRSCSNSSITGNKTHTKCPHGLCYARNEIFQLNEQRNSKNQTCLHGSPTLFSEIEHHSPESIEKEKELLEYKCNKNVCNRNELITKIQNIINELTQWNLKKKEEKPIDVQPRSLSIKQTISSYILVLVLIFIQLFI